MVILGFPEEYDEGKDMMKEWVSEYCCVPGLMTNRRHHRYRSQESIDLLLSALLLFGRCAERGSTEALYCGAFAITATLRHRTITFTPSFLQAEHSLSLLTSRTNIFSSPLLPPASPLLLKNRNHLHKLTLRV